MNRYPTIRPSSEWPTYVEPHTVTFVRHGEKAGPGFSADLTEKGRLDAESVGTRIRYPVDLFISSPSPRTVSTAECIRKGNGSNAPVIVEDQLADPGLGFYRDYSSAMKSLLTCISELIDVNGADTVIATTHNYVVEYVSNLPGCRRGQSELLSGITVSMELLDQICLSL